MPGAWGFMEKHEETMKAHWESKKGRNASVFIYLHIYIYKYIWRLLICCFARNRPSHLALSSFASSSVGHPRRPLSFAPIVRRPSVILVVRHPSVVHPSPVVRPSSIVRRHPSSVRRPPFVRHPSSVQRPSSVRRPSIIRPTFVVRPSSSSSNQNATTNAQACFGST
jgi:hypothetical protein